MPRSIFYLLTKPMSLSFCVLVVAFQGTLPFMTYLPLEVFSCLLESVHVLFILRGGFVYHQEKMNLNIAAKQANCSLAS